MRFVATTAHIAVGPGAYLRIVPEHAVDRRRDKLPDHLRLSSFAVELPPDMPAGAVVVLDGKPCPVLWAGGSRAVVEIAGRAWLLSHMTPWEMSLNRDAYELGSLVQEWIVRSPVAVPAKTGR